MKPTFYPGRLIFLVLVILLQGLFQDQWVGFGFGLTMAFITTRLFPIFEHSKQDDDQ